MVIGGVFEAAQLTEDFSSPYNPVGMREGACKKGSGLRTIPSAKSGGHVTKG